MEAYQQWMKDAEDYPLNLNTAEARLYNGDALKNDFDQRSGRLFSSSEARANLKVLENYRSDEEFHYHELKSSDDVEQHLFIPWRHPRTDPRCRYIFINARSSRSSLDCTRAMFCQVLTYHRVTPAFLDYVFPFGAQGARRDIHGGSFHSESCFPGDEPSHRNIRLGRSGYHLEYCFSLQSVEPSGVSHTPWSIRKCSVWHSFDLQQERQAWVIVKANEIIKDAIHSRVTRTPTEALDEQQSMGRALRLSLKAIVELATWSVQNWHRYINSLEEPFQKQTRSALVTKVGMPVLSAPPDYSQVQTTSRSSTMRNEPELYTTKATSSSKKKRWTVIRKPFKRRTMTTSKMYELDSWSDEYIEPERSEFSFEDLQSLQGFEEKANDVSMIMFSNMEVLRQLREEYRALIDSGDCPSDISKGCQKDVLRFERKLKSFEAEFEVLRARIQTFSSLLEERKALLYGVLEYRTMQANFLVSERAQVSTSKMEALTEKMHEIAAKTQTETVSMRIITVVTLFFLPGTFISTLMSTPIVTYHHGASRLSDSIISVGALQFYCVVSVPIMCVTFLAWWIYIRLEKRKQDLSDEAFRRSLHGAVAVRS